MIESLEDAQRLAASGSPIEIRREVRYYAVTSEKQYWLRHDWKLERLERKLWSERDDDD